MPVAVPDVSVVVPTCNRSAALVECLKALAAQTYPRYEVLVIDDASTDDTAARLAALAADHADVAVRILQNPEQRGANPSRNRGIRAARAPLVAFLDDDCVPQPDWLARLVAPFADRRVAAVSGLVRDVPPRNVFEHCFHGTHRLHRSGDLHRLVLGNLAVRRALLLKYRLDEDRAGAARDATGRPDLSVSGRGDEEGLFLRLRAAGYRQVAALDAVVTHDHPLSARAFFRQAWRGGCAAARLVYKFHLPPRLDLLPFLAAWATLPLMLLHVAFGGLALFCFGAGVAAISYNDLARKGKSVAQWLGTLPLLVVYYHVRLGGYVAETLRLHLTRHNLRRERLQPNPASNHA